MKKFLIAAALLAVSGAALADNDVGCGAGTQIWKGQSGLGPKVLAVTTNGIFGNQTFGITFGTLGCGRSGVITSNEKATNFVAMNGENLARDIAVGKGETLGALASIMGVTHKDAFFAATKANFSTIYAPENQTAAQILAAIKGVAATTL